MFLPSLNETKCLLSHNNVLRGNRGPETLRAIEGQGEFYSRRVRQSLPLHPEWGE